MMIFLCCYKQQSLLLVNALVGTYKDGFTVLGLNLHFKWLGKIMLLSHEQITFNIFFPHLHSLPKREGPLDDFPRTAISLLVLSLRLHALLVLDIKLNEPGNPL